MAAARERALVPEPVPRQWVVQFAPDSVASTPDVRQRVELARVQVRAPALLPDRVQVVALRLVEPPPVLAVVAQMSGRKLSAARLFPRWRAMQATGSFVSSCRCPFHVSEECLRSSVNSRAMAPQNRWAGSVAKTGFAARVGWWAPRVSTSNAI